jgi:hypothetical protein
MVEVDESNASQLQHQQSPDTVPLPPPPDTSGTLDQEEEKQRGEDWNEMEQQKEPQVFSEDNKEERLTISEEFMFGEDATITIDPSLLVFQKRALETGKRAGKRSRKISVERGRFGKAIFPMGRHR